MSRHVALHPALTSAPVFRAASPAPARHGRGQRDPAVAELLARLEIAATWRDSAAAARIIDSLARSGDGAWLVGQFCAAGLRAAADELAAS
jgi:thioredoxin-like negative regulator of GroEL